VREATVALLEPSKPSQERLRPPDDPGASLVSCAPPGYRRRLRCVAMTEVHAILVIGVGAPGSECNRTGGNPAAIMSPIATLNRVVIAVWFALGIVPKAVT
jgi:hypothetical protein